MRFFILARPMKQRDLWFQAVEDIPAERYFRGEEVPHGPVVFRRQTGSLPLDLMGGTYFTNNSVSQAFVEVLKSNGLTGWSTYPVRLFGKDDQELQGYHGLAVTGRSGPLDKSKCRVVKRLREDGTEIVRDDGSVSRERIGWFIEAESWDGRDFFVPERTRGICLTARAKEKLEAARLKGLKWIPNEETGAGLL